MTALTTAEIYLALCRMDRRGLTHTEEYRALNRLYHETIQREIAAGMGI